MIFSEVHNRGRAPEAFLMEMIRWAKTAPADIFEPNEHFDIYSKVRSELGPWSGPLHRRAVMLEVMRVLALFESGCDWTEGVDTSRLGDDTPENAEAGAWQVSYDARRLDSSLKDWLIERGILTGILFQRKMKFDHPVAMEFAARLLRIDVKNPERLHNGPLYRGDERLIIRKSLREEKHSIYPWLKRGAVEEFARHLSA